MMSGNLSKQADQDGQYGLDAAFAKEFAVGLGANGAMVSANLLHNSIDIKQAQKLAAVLNEHPTLKSLCGNKGDETELDMSGKEMGADGAIMLAPEIVANGAMTILDISNNQLGRLSIPEGWKTGTQSKGKHKGRQTFKAPGGKWSFDPPPNAKPDGVIAIANAIPAMGALTSLDISSNNIAPYAGGGKYVMSGVTALAAAIPECK